MMVVESLDTRDEKQLSNVEPVGNIVELPLQEGDPIKVTRMGSALSEEGRLILLEFLQRNADIFAWSPKDMSGLDPKVASHCLNVDPYHKPMKQKKSKFALERIAAIRTKVDKLLEAGFIREVHYLEWVANVVMVPNVKP